jgi:hypothetical protein
MNYSTVAGEPINSELLSNYFASLVNAFFKILPMRENGEVSLPTYMHSLQLELFGCRDLIPAISADPQLLTLLSILQDLISEPDTDVKVVKREVFKAIRICDKLKAIYATSEV